jgi:hypothetical protein
MGAPDLKATDLARRLPYPTGELSRQEDEFMQEGRYLGRLEPGMDVCDVDGNKFGSISRVYRNALVGVGGGTAAHDEILEVKTGLLGLGKHLFVPFGRIQDVTSGCVFINVPKDNVDEQGWDTRPDYIDELS